MRKKIAPEGLKSYLPCQFPYTDGEIREGLEDEVGIETWDYTDNEDYGYYSDFYGLSTYTLGLCKVYLVGTYDYENDTGEFGFIASTNNKGIYNLNSSGNYEFETFCNPDNLGSTYSVPNEAFQIILEHENEQGNYTADLQLSISSIARDNKEHGNYYNEGGSTEYQSKIILKSSAWSLNAEESQNIVITYEDNIDTEYDENWLNRLGRKEAMIWIKQYAKIYIVLRITDNIATVYIDGQERLRAILPSNIVLTPSRLRIGGFYGGISNYAFWHKVRIGNPEAPTAVYPSTFNVNEIGGFGTGADGDKVLSATSGTVFDFNCCGLVSEVTDARTLKVKAWVGGNSGVIASKGCEVMIHVTKPRRNEVDEWPYLGMYAFRRVARLKGTDIILNRGIREEIDGFTLSQELADEYYVQAIIVPNYRTFTNPSADIFPVKWRENECGGIVVFRTTGDCTLLSHITTHTYGGFRVYDNHTMSHSTLLNRFLCSYGGGVIIVCGGKFTAGCCIGTAQSLPTDSSAYVNGRAGHGGGTITSTYNGHGSNGTEPGKDYLSSGERINKDGIHSASGNVRNGGACIILVARTAAIRDDTYMSGGKQYGSIQTGGYGLRDVGGGCGFCYMAIGELVNG